MTGATGQAPDIARPPDPLIATPEGELVYSDFTIPLSAPATGAFALTNTLSINSLPLPGQASPFAAHQVNIVYRAPKSAVSVWPVSDRVEVCPARPTDGD